MLNLYTSREGSNLSNNIVNIIKKYTSYIVYSVSMKYTEYGCDRSSELFGIYTTYDRAYASIFIDINKRYKKYKKYPFEKKESFKMNFYKDYNKDEHKGINYIGSTTYTQIYTKYEKNSQYIYEITDHFINEQSPDGVGLCSS